VVNRDLHNALPFLSSILIVWLYLKCMGAIRAEARHKANPLLVCAIQVKLLEQIRFSPVLSSILTMDNLFAQAVFGRTGIYSLRIPTRPVIPYRQEKSIWKVLDTG
jgi:hypothetical protein